MNIKILQAAIAQCRANATEQELSELQEMLDTELDATTTQIADIEASRIESADRKAQEQWEQSPEGKEEKDWWASQITLWYNTESQRCIVNGSKKKPNVWDVWIEDSQHKFTGTRDEVMEHVESLVGTGKPYSPDPNRGAVSWRYRWFNYHNSEWLCSPSRRSVELEIEA